MALAQRPGNEVDVKVTTTLQRLDDVQVDVLSERATVIE
jgi:hypothetical protein